MNMGIYTLTSIYIRHNLWIDFRKTSTLDTINSGNKKNLPNIE